MNIRGMREYLGDEKPISKAEFSRRYNIPRITLEAWESGRRTPPGYIPSLLEKVVTSEEKVSIEKMDTKKMRKYLGGKEPISRAEFSRRYNIPIRTLEDWEAGKSSPPEYVLELLEQVVKLDK